MENDNSGETSKKKKSDISHNDRPLKKAKYLWQVKGKYHLKENIKVNNEEVSRSNKNNESSSKKIEGRKSSAQKVVSYNNNIAHTRSSICKDRSCIEALIANSDKIMVMDFPEPESPPTKNIDKSISEEIPITLVKPSPKNGDYFLRKWQARQIAKGFVDNTINRVLESWMIAPFVDATDFVENCDNGGQVEDEGIMMAIQSHGLQSGAAQRITRSDSILQSSSRSFHCKQSSNSNNSCTCSKLRTGTTLNKITPFHHRENNDFTAEYYENLCILKDSDSLKCVTEKDNSPESPSAERSSEISSPATATFVESKSVDEASNTYETIKMNDTDFLDAAVSAAIQKKGLTSYNYVDCG